MVKYILQNSRNFKNTGLTVSEVLDDKSLQERKKLREILKEERKNGKHAVIRNNKLYIDYKEYKLADTTPKAQNTNTLYQDTTLDGTTPDQSPDETFRN